MDALIIIRSIAEILLAVMLIAFTIYAIGKLKSISASIDKMKGDISRAYSDLNPVLKEITQVAGDIKEIAARSKSQYYKVENMVDSLTGSVNEASSIIRSAARRTKDAVDDGSNFISAITKGFRTFKSKLS